MLVSMADDDDDCILWRCWCQQIVGFTLFITPETLNSLAKPPPKMWACYQNVRRPHFINWNPSLQIYTLLQILTDFMRLPCSWAKSQVSILENRTAFRPQLSFYFKDTDTWYRISFCKICTDSKTRLFFSSLLSTIHGCIWVLCSCFVRPRSRVGDWKLWIISSKHKSFSFNSIPLNFIL